MMGALTSASRRFRRDEEGAAVVEFAITFPAMLFLLLSGVELGMMSLQHQALERALDLTVRDIRLGTGSAPQHNEIKDLICERAGYVGNCGDNLRLEMVLLNPRDWVDIDVGADCTDQSQEVAPYRSFVNDAGENELMVMRACAKIDPVFPTTWLGANFVKDGAGQYALVSTTVFVQEPN
jgi:hypothetical protein